MKANEATANCFMPTEKVSSNTSWLTGLVLVISIDKTAQTVKLLYLSGLNIKRLFFDIPSRFLLHVRENKNKRRLFERQCKNVRDEKVVKCPF